MLNIVELFKLRGLDVESLGRKSKIKLIRHQSPKYDLLKLYRHGHIKIYQEVQRNPVFDGSNYIISFIGVDGTKAKFIGMYKVLGREDNKLKAWPKNYTYPDMYIAKLYYHTTEISGFEDFKSRLVIDWGKSTRSWHQWLSEKPVVEILPQGYTKEFSEYHDLILDFIELKEIINNPDANREWHLKLSAVAGIYLIVDIKTGKQYIGSAYGNKGILGRWKNYAYNSHGGNDQLKELIGNNTQYCNNFQFSILRTLPKSLTPREVIDYEGMYKIKLGSRAFGLNSN